MNFWALDAYDSWGEAACAVATARGHRARRVSSSAQVDGDGIGFVRLSMEPHVLPRNRHDYARMASRLTMIQDATQVEVYEDKWAQSERWADWMPDTWRFNDAAQALAFVEHADLPIVSKAREGASSVNVRVLETREQLRAHVRDLFGRGVPMDRNRVQRGYAILQRFIPHKVTYRVNAIGGARAVFHRYCYHDRPVAQTGNVEPVMHMDEQTESLLAYADAFFAHAGTQWCAIDILDDEGTWRLLETSEGWPWPSPGTCNDAPIFRSKGRRWIQMFEVMWDEIERGAWS